MTPQNLDWEVNNLCIVLHVEWHYLLDVRNKSIVFLHKKKHIDIVPHCSIHSVDTSQTAKVASTNERRSLTSVPFSVRSLNSCTRLHSSALHKSDEQRAEHTRLWNIRSLLSKAIDSTLGVPVLASYTGGFDSLPASQSKNKSSPISPAMLRMYSWPRHLSGSVNSL